METIIKNTNEDDAFTKAKEILTAGGLVAFPTETVYGLGGNELRFMLQREGRPIILLSFIFPIRMMFINWLKMCRKPQKNLWMHSGRVL